MSMRYPNGGFIAPGFNPVLIPGAPTIGTATAGNAQATVTFTAPTDGSVVTSYTVISTPGNFTATGSASPLTVTGLSNGTAYTFRVFATNSYGNSAFSAASNSVTPVPAIGSSFGGGFYAGQISTTGDGVATHFLIVAPKSTGELAEVQWKTSDTTTSGTTSVINGPTNSANMNNASHPAAQFCEGLTIGGFTDWYMPARNELEIIYFNLKPTTEANNTSAGANPNAVPPRASNYTSGTPARTSVAIFQSGGAQALIDTYYWSSTELSSTNASAQRFATGLQGSELKTTPNFYVRAVRRIPI